MVPPFPLGLSVPYRKGTNPLTVRQPDCLLLGLACHFVVMVLLLLLQLFMRILADRATRSIPNCRNQLKGETGTLGWMEGQSSKPGIKYLSPKRED